MLIDWKQIISSAKSDTFDWKMVTMSLINMLYMRGLITGPCSTRFILHPRVLVDFLMSNMRFYNTTHSCIIVSPLLFLVISSSILSSPLFSVPTPSLKSSINRTSCSSFSLSYRVFLNTRSLFVPFHFQFLLKLLQLKIFLELLVSFPI